MMLDTPAHPVAGRIHPGGKGSSSVGRFAAEVHGLAAALQTRLRQQHDLRRRVVEALANSGHPPLSALGCDVRGNKLVLRGSVPSYYLKQLAQVFAQRVDGVESIENRLQVRDVPSRLGSASA